MERGESEPHPSAAEIERAREIAWVREHLEFFWSFASEEYQESGRGALVVDTNQVVEQEGEATHPILYLPQTDLGVYQWANQNEIVRMVGEYNPSWEFVTVLIKADSESAYRMGVYVDNPTNPGRDVVQ